MKNKKWDESVKPDSKIQILNSDDRSQKSFSKKSVKKSEKEVFKNSFNLLLVDKAH